MTATPPRGRRCRAAPAPDPAAGAVSGAGARPISLLWALRSPCNLECRYCYFGTIEDDRGAAAPPGPGVLSHLARTDLPAEQALEFAAGLARSSVGRVFLAGGEPLIWPPILDLIRELKAAGVQVVVCTNGIPLNRPAITGALVDLGVDAVSVSLDSTDPGHNDTWRPARNRRDGWQQVIDGTRALLAARAHHRTRDGYPRVGFYSVITAANLPDIQRVPRLAADLGCDYAVPQPISLPPASSTDSTAASGPGGGSGGDLRGRLALTGAHLTELRAHFTALYSAGLDLRLPPDPYPGYVADAVTQPDPPAAPAVTVRGCFAGRTLSFIEPDGSVWDCPSTRKIAATPPARRRTIRGTEPADLFPPPAGHDPRGRGGLGIDGCGCSTPGAGPGDGPADCGLFSVDCVNMWPLMAFDRILAPVNPGAQLPPITRPAP